jgi:hypothetical protein
MNSSTRVAALAGQASSAASPIPKGVGLVSLRHRKIGDQAGGKQISLMRVG